MATPPCCHHSSATHRPTSGRSGNSLARPQITDAPRALQVPLRPSEAQMSKMTTLANESFDLAERPSHGRTATVTTWRRVAGPRLFAKGLFAKGLFAKGPVAKGLRAFRSQSRPLPALRRRVFARRFEPREHRPPPRSANSKFVHILAFRMARRCRRGALNCSAGLRAWQRCANANSSVCTYLQIALREPSRARSTPRSELAISSLVDLDWRSARAHRIAHTASGALQGIPFEAELTPGLDARRSDQQVDQERRIFEAAQLHELSRDAGARGVGGHAAQRPRRLIAQRAALLDLHLAPVRIHRHGHRRLQQPQQLERVSDTIEGLAGARLELTLGFDRVRVVPSRHLIGSVPFAACGATAPARQPEKWPFLAGLRLRAIRTRI